MIAIPRTPAWLLTAMLAGCGSTAGTLDGRRAELPQPSVRVERLYHDVAFRPGQAALGDGERRDLLSFLGTLPAAAGDRVIVVVEPTAAPSLADRRRRDLLALLRNSGVDAEGWALPGAPSTADQGGLVIVERLVAEAPAGCRSGGLESRYGADAPLHSFGCATAANLAAMADPADLLQGRPLDAGDGERAAFLVRSYRTRPVTEDRKVPAEIGYAASGGGDS